MSRINRAIDRFAIAAEQKKQRGGEPPIYPYLSMRLGGLPRLSSEQIDELTMDLPFQLPLELYELYQRGNGCLPIGLGVKDWDNPENYCMFQPYGEGSLDSLEESIQWLDDDLIRLKLLPIAYHEEKIYAVQCSETRQYDAPVLRSYIGNDYYVDASLEWSNLTDPILAFSEMVEQDLKTTDETEIRKILEKYGRVTYSRGLWWI
jgi:hypothetical protein